MPIPFWRGRYSVFKFNTVKSPPPPPPTHTHTHTNRRFEQNSQTLASVLWGGGGLLKFLPTENFPYTSITKISITLNVINFGGKFFSCGLIYEGNFVMYVTKFPLCMIPQLKTISPRFMKFNVTDLFSCCVICTPHRTDVLMKVSDVT